MRIAFTLTLFCLLLGHVSTPVFGQTKTITGIVVDTQTQEPLIQVAIRAKDNMSIGAVTDMDGKFSINLPATTNMLVVTYVGYTPREVPITSVSGNLKITLQASDIVLDKATVTAGRSRERALDAPASIAIIEQKEIKASITPSPTDYLRNASGVDIIKTGIATNNVVVRGFNSLFSGSLLTLVDNRIASIPSIRLNAQQMIPATPADIDRIEVLKGPASAMYGPNSANGVVHIITQSPLDLKKRFETTIGTGIGWRTRLDGVVPNDVANDPLDPVYDDGQHWATNNFIRTAGKLRENPDGLSIGYKVSAKYFTGYDWKYSDPQELGTLPSSSSDYGKYIVLSQQTPYGTYYGDSIMQVINGDTIRTVDADTVANGRNTRINNYNIDARLDFRYKNGMELIFSGGRNSFTGVEVTGVGAGQAQNWKYDYGQVRLIYKKFFVQAYMNASNSGETYLFRSGNFIIDKSKFWSVQTQHSSLLLNNKLKLIYGIDALMTRPNTENTINGRFEDDDDINELGGYVQTDYKVNDKLNFMFAVRADKHTYVKDMFVSPRAAALYKLDQNNTFRLTYNRAFTSPSAINTAFDILTGVSPTGMQVRGIGNTQGIVFQRADGIPQFRVPTVNNNHDPSAYFNLNSDAGTTAQYQVMLNLLANGLAQNAASIGLPVTADLVQLLVNAVLPDSLHGVQNIVRALDLDAQAYHYEDTLDINNIADFAPLKNSPTQTWEVGYKGIIKNKLAITLDVYHTETKDFISPLRMLTPNVFLEQNSLRAYLEPAIYQRMHDPANQVFANFITMFLDTLSSINVGGNVVPVNGNNNGDGSDELTNLLVNTSSYAPTGTVSPEIGNDASMLLSYVNVGNVSLWGGEFSAVYYANKDLKIGLNYAYVSKDRFSYVAGYNTLELALNAPKHKVGLSVQYGLPKWGLDMGLKYRWLDAYRVNSGVYQGTVKAAHLFDLNLGYTLPFSKKTQVAMSMQNVFDYARQEFVGTPPIGRFTMFQVSQTF